LPFAICQLLGVVEEAFIREVIYVDPVNQITSMASINLSLSQYMYVQLAGLFVSLLVSTSEPFF
jgi:hypothetical protein